MDASKQELGRLRRTADTAAKDCQSARAEVSPACMQRIHTDSLLPLFLLMQRCCMFHAALYDMTLRMLSSITKQSLAPGLSSGTC